MTYGFELAHGDCIEVMRAMPDNSVDAIVTDPPYELGFMGKGWDKSGIANNVNMWREALRVLKPGGHLLAFSGSRTYHRMTCAIEDAGFEVRDQIMWLYGSGFPKSLNVAKAIESGGGRPEDIRRMQMGEGYEPSGRGRVNYDHGSGSAMDAGSADWHPATEAARQWQGWGTALKPAHEPICVARKPLSGGTVAANVLAHGTGALNIDGCRVGWPDGKPPEIGTPGWGGPAKTLTVVPGQEGATVDRSEPNDLGRWPANIIHDGSDEVLAAFPQAKGQQGKLTGTEPSNKTANTFGDFAARFFYCAKASRADRGEGNTHPTVKPTDLMRYLCRLVTPPGGVVLDPFMGSGSTGKAAVLEGFRFIGIDMTAEYVAIARGRIGYAAGADLC